MEAHNPATTGPDSAPGIFTYEVLAPRILSVLSQGPVRSRNALRAQVVWPAVDGSNRASFHRGFEAALSQLLSMGAVVSSPDGVVTASLTESPPDVPAQAGRDWARRPIDRPSVLAAMAEFDREGRHETLARHGFRSALDYVVVHNEKDYDSKALYGIAYGIRYPAEQPIKERGLTGGVAVTRKLEALGFHIKRLRAPADAALARPDARAWIVRAGDRGENESLARAESVAFIGGPDLGAISPSASQPELEAMIQATGASDETTAERQANAIHRFMNDLQVGDLVVLPLRSKPGSASIGVLEGEFRYRSDGPFEGRLAHYQRTVNWLQWAVPYESFDADLQSAFRASGPVSEIQTDNPVSRLIAASSTADETAWEAEQDAGIDFVEPPLSTIRATVNRVGMRLDARTLHRYHLSLKTRGFVVLAGVSGGGKTLLARTYADAIGAQLCVVAVAPNWTTNEDLLGYLNPIDGIYRHTEVSKFLLRAATEYGTAIAQGRTAQPFHLVLDEMNLARVEYYFAKFLSAMELRSSAGTSVLSLSPDVDVQLGPNLMIIGTVNVDETTFGFADKVYDRAQLIELDAPRDEIAKHIGERQYRDILLAVRDACLPVAPFAFRVVDEIEAYISASVAIGTTWQQAFDDQLLQKMLPKIKGTDPKIRVTLETLRDITMSTFPLSHLKIAEMLEDFNAHGFASFF